MCKMLTPCKRFRKALEMTGSCRQFLKSDQAVDVDRQMMNAIV